MIEWNLWQKVQSCWDRSLSEFQMAFENREMIQGVSDCLVKCIALRGKDSAVGGNWGALSIPGKLWQVLNQIFNRRNYSYSPASWIDNAQDGTCTYSCMGFCDAWGMTLRRFQNVRVRDKFQIGHTFHNVGVRVCVCSPLEICYLTLGMLHINEYKCDFLWLSGELKKAAPLLFEAKYMMDLLLRAYHMFHLRGKHFVWMMALGTWWWQMQMVEVH